MSQPQFLDTKGVPYYVPGATPVNPPTPNQEPTIPSNAQVVHLVDDPNWQGKKDAGTPGTASGNTTLSADKKSRVFSLTFGDNGGFRWHNMFAVDTKSTHFCYDVTVSVDNPKVLGQLELDVTQVLDKTSVCYLCTQANSNSKAWDYTTTPQGKCHWNHSTIQVNPVTWTPNEKYHIKVYTHREPADVVVYDGIFFNGVYTAFDPSCKGVSVLDQQWDVGHTLINFQANGRATSGKINLTVTDLTVSRW